MYAVMKVDGEVLQLHCDHCNRKCFAPTEQQIREWELACTRGDESMTFLCDLCYARHMGTGTIT